jgi:hypothetical protein
LVPECEADAFDENLVALGRDPHDEDWSMGAKRGENWTCVKGQDCGRKHNYSASHIITRAMYAGKTGEPGLNRLSLYVHNCRADRANNKILAVKHLSSTLQPMMCIENCWMSTWGPERPKVSNIVNIFAMCKTCPSEVNFYFRADMLDSVAERLRSGALDFCDTEEERENLPQADLTSLAMMDNIFTGPLADEDFMKHCMCLEHLFNSMFIGAMNSVRKGATGDGDPSPWDRCLSSE